MNPSGRVERAREFILRRAPTLLALVVAAHLIVDAWGALGWVIGPGAAGGAIPWALGLKGTALIGVLLGLLWLGRRDREPAPESEAVDEAAPALDTRRSDAEGGFRRLLDCVHDAVLVIDSERRILEANEAACATFGYASSEIQGMSADLLLRGQSLSDALSPAGESGQVAGPHRMSAEGRRRGGRRFAIELRTLRLDDPAHGTLVSIRDSSAQEEQGEELRQALRAAEAANRAKTEFLTNMSHEIRTPMTAILGYAECLGDSSHSPAQQEEWSATIRRNGQHLLSIINDILDLSRIEAGRMTFEEVDHSPAQLLSDVADMMRLRAGRQAIGFVVGIDDSLPGTIRSDPTRLRQILINLIGNAIKFTAEGEVRVTAGLVKLPDREPLLQVEIEDTGIGMSPDQLAQVFEPFSQTDASVTRRFGGTGLGLAISRRLARLLGGDIEAWSEVNVGSRFRVTVPTGPLGPLAQDAEVPLAEPPTPQHLSAPPGGALAGARLLLAEDGEDNRRLLSMMLEKAGASVDLAENGREAVTTVFPEGLGIQAGEDPTPYDLILMDMQMPVLDGYEATTELRGLGYDGPIVALTAHAMGSDRQRCIDAGCDDHIGKPVGRKDLVRAVARYVGEKEDA